MLSEKNKKIVKLKKRGRGLRTKLSLFTTSLILLVILMISIPMYMMMTTTMRETLFESLYDRIKDNLIANKDQFKLEIEGFKDLISEITDLSVSIQAGEVRNKTMVEKFFAKSREDLQAERIRAKSAYDFMNRNTNQEVEPRFMDTKK